MSRAGVVLVLVLLVVLALELLAMSAFGFARIAGLGSRHALRHAGLAIAADAAAETALAAVDADAVAAAPVHALLPLPTAGEAPLSATAGAIVLPHGVVLARASVHAPDGGRARALALGRVLTPADLLAAFPAIVSVLETPQTGLPVLPEADTACATLPGPAPIGLPPLLDRAPGDTLPFGDRIRLRWDDAARLATAATGSVPGLTVLSGAVALDSAVSGVLVVDGDLVLRRDVRVAGLLVVRGLLTLEAGAHVDGALRARAVVADADARMAYDRCAVRTALAAPVFHRVYRIGARWRLPAH